MADHILDRGSPNKVSMRRREEGGREAGLYIRRGWRVRWDDSAAWQGGSGHGVGARGKMGKFAKAGAASLNGERSR